MLAYTLTHPVKTGQPQLIQNAVSPYSTNAGPSEMKISWAAVPSYRRGHRAIRYKSVHAQGLRTSGFSLLSLPRYAFPFSNTPQQQ